MNSKRAFFTLLIIIILLVAGLFGGVYIANGLMKQQSKRLADNRLEVAKLGQEQIQLSRAKKDIDKYKSLSEIAKAVVPQDKDQAQTTREIVNIAKSHGIVISSITFPASLLGTTVNGVKSTTSTKLSLSQLTPVKGISGVYVLQVTVQNDQSNPVDYNSFIDFLSGLEQNRRTALISGITIQPDSKDPSKVSFTLILDEYIKP